MSMASSPNFGKENSTPKPRRRISHLTADTLEAAVNAYNPHNYLPLDHPVSVSALVNSDTPELQYLRKRVFEDMSADEKFVCRLSFSNGDPNPKYCNTDGIFIKGNLRLDLERTHKWTGIRIDKTFQLLRARDADINSLVH